MEDIGSSESKIFAESKNDALAANEPIIKFSPDRCRFDSSRKSRHASIVSDFEPSNTLEGPCNSIIPSKSHFQPDPTYTADSLTELLLTSCDPINSSLTASAAVLPSTECQMPDSPRPHQPNPSLSQKPHPNPNSAIAKSKISTSNGNSDLHKKLEKQIAQAAVVATTSSKWKPSTAGEEETEFGEWNGSAGQGGINPPNNSVNNASGVESSSSSIRFGENNNNSPSTINSTTTARIVDEVVSETAEEEVVQVGIISKSRRKGSSGFDTRKLSGGLIPPERLAVPGKGYSNSNRKHLKLSPQEPDTKSSKLGSSSGKSGGIGFGGRSRRADIDDNITNNHDGNATSENKPLVQWDSDGSEEELSFFPAPKGRAKLTDNLSIDNMSLSGEEDDLHLSPPRPLTRGKCPCDPRSWINDLQTSRKNSTSRETSQCIIT